MPKQILFKLELVRDFPVHPTADAFPMLTGPAADALAADIEKHGLKSPLEVFSGEDGKHLLIDGRNRRHALVHFGTEHFAEVPCNVWTAKELPQNAIPEFIASVNLHRRNLTKSQTALIAVRVYRESKPSKQKQHKNWRGSIATLYNVSERQVAHAAVVLDSGNKPLIEAVEKGDLALFVAEGVARAGVPPQEIEQLSGVAAEAAEAAGSQDDPDAMRQSAFRSGARALVRAHSSKSKGPSVSRTPSGEEIPKHLRAVFQRAARVANLVSTTRNRVKTLVEEPVAEGSTSSLAEHLSPQILAQQRVWTEEIMLNLPEEICPACAGNGCEICKTGWLSKSGLVRLAPKLKAAAARKKPSSSAAKKSR